MLTSIKSLVAVGLALLVIIGAGLWLKGRTGVLKALKNEKREAETAVAELEARSAAAAEMEARLEAIVGNITAITEGFAKTDHGGIELVEAIVKAASLSDMAMTGASEISPGDRTRHASDAGVSVEIISYRISLKGSYAGLVKLLQNLGSWKLQNKIESLEISGEKSEESAGVVRAELVLSIFADRT